MTNPKKSYKNRAILSNEEIDAMLKRAGKITDNYHRLRAKALVALAKKFGKRRSEIAALLMVDLEIKEKYLVITFTIRKKHKKGLFQFIKFLKKQIKDGKIPNNYLDNKTYSELIGLWQEWTRTEEGYRIKEEKRIKKLALEDKFCKLIIEYYRYMKRENPDMAYLFPSGFYAFGNLVTLSPTDHLSGRQLLRLIKQLDKKAWLHLFRETKGAEIAKDYGNNLAGITAVRDTLDLENEETAFRYTRRYAIQEIKPET